VAVVIATAHWMSMSSWRHSSWKTIIELEIAIAEIGFYEMDRDRKVRSGKIRLFLMNLRISPSLSSMKSYHAYDPALFILVFLFMFMCVADADA
jgi:hypothetical protein